MNMVQLQSQSTATFTSQFSTTTSSSTSTEPDANGHCLTNNGTNSAAHDHLEFHDSLPLNSAAALSPSLMMVSQSQPQQQLNLTLVSSASTCLESNNMTNSQNAIAYTQGITSPLVCASVPVPASMNGTSSAVVEQQTVSYILFDGLPFKNRYLQSIISSSFPSFSFQLYPSLFLYSKPISIQVTKECVL